MTMPQPSGFNLPPGVTLADIDPGDPECERCGEECAGDRDFLYDGLCPTCRRDEEHECL